MKPGHKISTRWHRWRINRTHWSRWNNEVVSKLLDFNKGFPIFIWVLDKSVLDKSKDDNG